MTEDSKRYVRNLSAEATLYTGKCEFSKRELKFAGYVPNQDEKFAIGRGQIPSTS